jgi:hypothetical protein
MKDQSGTRSEVIRFGLTQAAFWLFLIALLRVSSRKPVLDVAFIAEALAIAVVSTAAWYLLRKRQPASSLDVQWTAVRTLVFAICMALPVGVVIGGLLATRGSASDLIGGSVVSTILAWIALSLIWAIPVSLAIRAKGRARYR